MTADKREFLKISQAVGVGFLVMGVIGYVVKLSTSPSPPPLSSPSRKHKGWKRMEARS